MATSGGEGFAPTARIGTMVLVAGAIRRVRHAGRPLLLLWLAIAAVDWAITSGARSAGFDATGAGLSVGGVAGEIASLLVNGLGAAIGLRILLEGPARWAQLDRPLLECAGLLAAMSAVFVLVTWAYAGPSPQTAPGEAPMAAVAVSAGLLVALYMLVKLILWPIARLMRRPEVNAWRSWRLMRKATRGYVLAHGLLLIPLMVGYGFVFANLGVEGVIASPVVAGAFTFAMAGFSILSMAIDATLYNLRVESPATVADVFA